MPARVAVLIPTYNSSSTLAETLESLAGQSAIGRVGRIEVSDDASSDGTPDLAQRWGGELPINVHRNAVNVGERANVNRAFADLSDGFDWVFILHADDIAKPNWLAAMLERIDAAPDAVASVCSSWDTFFEDGRVEPGEDDIAKGTVLVKGGSQAVNDTLLQGCWWHVSGSAIRLDTVRQVGGFKVDMPQLGDWEWLLRTLQAGWSIQYIPLSLIRYRQHGASVSTTSFRENRDLAEAVRLGAMFRPVMHGDTAVRFRRTLLRRAVRRVAGGVLRRSPARSLSAARVFVHALKMYSKPQG